MRCVVAMAVPAARVTIAMRSIVKENRKYFICFAP
jgi:hypothetical protein